MSETFTEYQVKREVAFEVAEHETHLSFNSDWQSVAFQEWLYVEGMAHFAEWLKANKENYQ